MRGPGGSPAIELRLAATASAFTTAAAAAKVVAAATAAQDENDDNDPPAATAAKTVITEHKMYSIPPPALRLSDLISWFMFEPSLLSIAQ